MWVLRIILLNCGFFIAAVVICDDVTQVYGSYGKSVDLLWQHLYSKHYVYNVFLDVFNLLCVIFYLTKKSNQAEDGS